MWQRIQTLYLLIASGLLVAMYFQPYGTWFIVLFSLALACQLLAIVALKSRTLQMRLSNLSFTTIFPIIAAILDFLAARAILRDELLVRSASRLRASKRK